MKGAANTKATLATPTSTAAPQPSAEPQSQPQPQPQPWLTRRPTPTRAGIGFLVALLVGLVGCINYDLSLGYALIFLMAGVWVTSAALTARQAREVSLRLRPPPRVVAGETALYRAEWARQGDSFAIRGKLTAPAAAQAFTIPAHIDPDTPAPTLELHPPARGPFTPQVQLTLYGPLGLWKVQRQPQPERPLLVWPRPEVNVLAPPQGAYIQGEEGVQRVRGGSDFAGLRGYVPGDSPRQVAWRRSAGREHMPGGGLLVRETDAPAALASALRWADTQGDTEARVARLAGWVQALSEAGLPFSLNLPNADLPLGAGEAQRVRAMEALARVEPLPQPEQPPRGKVGFWDTPLTIPAWIWTLGTLGVVLLPTLWRTPIWASLLTAGLLVYGYLRHTRRGTLNLTTTMLAGVAVLGALGLYFTHNTLIGLEAGTNVLTLLLALKVAESRTHRDGVLLVLLGFFTTLTHFLHDMGPLQALHALISAVLLLGALHLWSLPSNHHTDNKKNGNKKGTAETTGKQAAFSPRSLLRSPVWKVGGQMALLSLPLMLALFFFFPRPAEPLWQMGRGGAETGLGSSVSAGDITDLAKSDALAFRASFEGAAPPQSELYWRGPVYEAFDGIEWNLIRGDIGIRPSVKPIGESVSYSVVQEPSVSPWVMALATVQQAPQDVLVFTNMTMMQLQRERNNRFQITSAPSLVGLNEAADRLQFNTQYPVGANPKAEALAKSWQALPPKQRVQEALNLFAGGGYSYTLSPPLLPKEHRVDTFLFETKAGFCEHYASAFGYLMRAANVPTRVVAGYQGGDVSTLSDGRQVVTVRQASAHAWNEVWLEGEGWVRVDPTAVVAPARIITDPETALSNPSATTSSRQQSLWNRLRSGYDTLQIQWYDMVVGFDDEQQSGALSDLGFGEIGGSRYWVGFGLLGALALLPMLWAWRRQSRPSDPAARAVFDLTQRLGIPKEASEPISHYVRRVGEKHSHLRAPLQEFADTYNRLRYGQEESNPQLLSRLRQLIRQVRRP